MRYSTELKKEAVKMVKSGLTIAAVAKKLGVSAASIQVWKNAPLKLKAKLKAKAKTKPAVRAKRRVVRKQRTVC